MLLYEIASRSAILLILDVVFDADSRGSNRLANLELFSVVSRSISFGGWLGEFSRPQGCLLVLICLKLPISAR